MNKEQIIVSIYCNPNIENYCRTIKPDDWEELKSELIIQIFKISEATLIDANNQNFLEYLCFKIIKRITYGTIKSTGIFHKSGIVVFGEHNFVDQSAPNHDEILRKIWDMVDKEHYYAKTLFTEYYRDGLTLKEISKKYGINLKSIHYTIKKLRNKIIKQINEEKD